MMTSDFPRLPDPDFDRAAKDATKNIFIEYKSGTILQKDGRFKWNFKWYDSLVLAKEAIDRKMDTLSSLKIEVIIYKNDGSETLLTDEQGKIQYLIGRSPYEQWLNKQQP